MGDGRCDGEGGLNGDHCCYRYNEFMGEGAEYVCPFLEIETVPGRYYACGALRVEGSWEAVYSRQDYIEVWSREWRCGDWNGGHPPVERTQCCYARLSHG